MTGNLELIRSGNRTIFVILAEFFAKMSPYLLGLLFFNSRGSTFDSGIDKGLLRNAEELFCS
jgi:hypothetical protein